MLESDSTRFACHRSPLYHTSARLKSSGERGGAYSFARNPVLFMLGHVTVEPGSQGDWAKRPESLHGKSIVYNNAYRALATLTKYTIRRLGEKSV